MRFSRNSGGRIGSSSFAPPQLFEIRLNFAAISGSNGQTKLLATSSVFDQYGGLSAGTITWSSSNAAIATVDTGGLVTFQATKGVCVVVASASAVRTSKTCTVISF